MKRSPTGRLSQIRNCKTAFGLSAAATIATWFVAWLLFHFLPISPERLSLSFGCLLVGCVLGLGVFWLLTILPNKRVVRLSAYAIAFLLLAAPWGSSWMGRISYSRFGLTIYGLVPIPTLDITVNQRGVLWFRPKTHLIQREEIARLLEPDTEVVVIGIGWDRIARVEADALPVGSQVELKVLSTPEAFLLFNLLKSQGRRAVLIAHSTC